MSTGINYLDETWNPVTGCSGKGCKVRDRCWAKEISRRFPLVHGFEGIRDEDGYMRGHEPVPFSKVQFHPERLDKPLHWKKPRRIGVCFTGDMFDGQVSFQQRGLILRTMVRTPQHQYFLLTKQINNMRNFWDGCISHGIIPSIPPWIFNGVSITDQEDVHRMTPELLKIPGRKWLSIEPMLSEIDFNDLNEYLYQQCTVCWGPGEDDWGYDIEPREDGIEWAVIGCESGPKRRHISLEAIQRVVTEFQDAQIPVFVKQLDINSKVVHDIEKFPKELQVREYPE